MKHVGVLAAVLATALTVGCGTSGASAGDGGPTGTAGSPPGAGGAGAGGGAASGGSGGSGGDADGVVGPRDHLSCAGETRGVWTPISTAGAPSPSAPSPSGLPALFWTGQEMLVYAGSQGFYAPCPAPGAPATRRPPEPGRTWCRSNQLGIRSCMVPWARTFGRPTSLQDRSPASASTAPCWRRDRRSSRSEPASRPGWWHSRYPAISSGFDGTSAGAIFDLASSTWRPMATAAPRRRGWRPRSGRGRGSSYGAEAQRTRS